MWFHVLPVGVQLSIKCVRELISAWNAVMYLMLKKMRMRIN